MVNKRTFIEASTAATIVCCTVTMVGASGKLVTKSHTASTGAVAELKQALKVAAQRALTSGFPSFGPNPYAPVLGVLREEKNYLPAIWRARALARYAVYLYSPVLSFANASTEEILRKRSVAVLHQAVAIAPSYTNGWVMLARNTTARLYPDSQRLRDLSVMPMR